MSKIEKQPFKLHDNLILGVATASAQIEGDETNHSWYEWSMKPGKIIDGTNTLRANQHYRLYEEDILLMVKMKIQTYRFSIEWSRIEPSCGVFNEEAIEHYRNELRLLKKYNIKPLVTLHHFSNPLWFEHIGGFLNKHSIEYFKRYTEYVVKALGDLATEYITINEPNVYATNGYFLGIWPPGEKSFLKTVKVMRNLAKCHHEAYKAIKEYNNKYRVGYANHLIVFVPLRENNIFDKISTKLVDIFFQKALTKAMAFGKFRFPFAFYHSKKSVYYDFVGINYYTRRAIKGFNFYFLDNVPKNDLGWEIYPEGLAKLVDEACKLLKKEIYITENGTCDHLDAFRKEYIYDHLKEIANKKYVTRYYYWSFMDNFEWAEGESIRFGLVACNYETQERIIRPSGYFYQDIITNKGVNNEMINKYLKN